MNLYKPVPVLPLPIEEVQQRLKARGSEFIGTNWQCPSHDDRNPSLSVRENANHSVSVNCFARCDRDAVLEKLDLDSSDLDAPKPSWTTTATHVYERADGSLLTRKVRKEDQRGLKPKRFIVQSFNGQRWVNGGTADKLLYVLPEVRRVAAAGGTVVVMEGEKAADAFNTRDRRPPDIVATTAIDGASGKWLDSYTADLEGASKIILVPDRDSTGTGYGYMLRVYRALKTAGFRVFFRQPATTNDKDDVYDHFKAGYAWADMEKLKLATVIRLAGVEAESKAPQSNAPKYEFNDVGRAERLRDQCGGDLRDVAENGWRTFDGRAWVSGPAAAAQVNARLREVAASIRDEADRAQQSGTEADIKRAGQLRTEAGHLGNNRNINAALAQAALIRVCPYSG